MLLNLFSSLRPTHWLKNALVFAPAFFSGRMNDQALARSACVFAVFCAAASAMYLLNDVADRRDDAAHPVKKKRALASGRLEARHHVAAAAFLCAAALGGAFLVGRGVLWSAAAYLCVGAAYSFLLKKIPGAGFVAIGAGLVLRVTAGAAAVEVAVSPWVYPCVLLLAVYVAAGKRVFDAGGYAPGMNAALALTGAATLAAYLAYSVSLENAHKYESRLLVLTALPALAGLARYFFLVKRPRPGREHLEATASDPGMIVSLLAWLAVFAWMIYSA